MPVMFDVGTFKALIVLIAVYGVLRLGRGGPLLPEIETAVGGLFKPQPRGSGRQGGPAVIALAVTVIVFALLMAKFGGGLISKWPFDQFWHQAMVDYDALWRTPWLSIPGNALYQFDMRLPVTSHLMPALGLSELFPPAWRVAASYVVLFAGMMLLFWCVGATLGLRPLPRAVFAGLVALMVVVPVGIDKIVWFFPVNFFTTQSLLATWWGEAPMLALATVLAFYWIGGCAGPLRNALCVLAFAAGAGLAVFAYPAGAVYFVPIVGVYCAVFLLTSRSRGEAIWKLAAGGGVTLAMLALQVPRFFINLYGYTFGSYFFEQVRAPAASLIGATFMIDARDFDLRAVFVFFVSIMAALVLAGRGPAPVRRFAIGILACEAAIVGAGFANALTLRAPLLFAYAETAHSALWGSFFVLVAMAIATLIDRRLAGGMPAFAAHRRMIYGGALAAVLILFAAFGPSPPVLAYPPQTAPALEKLAHDLSIAPGTAFRGKVATIYAREGATLFEAKAFAYRDAFGSDFYSDLLPLGIPSLNQSQHWTSPVTFAFLHRFFAGEGDSFEKNFFWLDRFDGRIARLLGVSAVVSDREIAGARLNDTLSRDGRTLRIYRLDDVNLGQYSPTRVMRVASATDAVRIIASDGFEPKRDAVVEEAIGSELVPAQSVSVSFERGPVLRIRAVSPGQSLLVLPFEFSHCQHVAGSQGARLIPVNLQQLGLLFDRTADVSIEYRYGVFDSACRGADLARARALDLHAIVKTPAR
ncbi:MAG: hypothetical protein JSR72_08845 [Proteobacteria bacterium]|nr:hypothetical protein [Pseudomonadota bacterium]